MVLRLRTESPKVWEKAKCASLPVTRDYDPFFSEDEDEKNDAIRFCNGTDDGVTCPVRHECLIFALSNNCKEGIWGGTSESTRKAIRKRYPPLRNQIREEWEWKTERQALSEAGRPITDLPEDG